MIAILKRFKFRSLKTQLFMGGIALLLIQFVLMTLNTNKLFNEFAIESVKTTISQLGETLNVAVTPYASKDEIHVMQEYFRELIEGNSQSITYIAIVDSNKSTLASTLNAPPYLYFDRPSIEVQIDTGTIHAVQPILMKDHSIATLYYGISTQLLVNTSQRIYKQNILVMFLLISGTLIVLTLLLSRLGKRFQHLTEHSQALANGNYHQRLMVNSDDEISQLSDHINHMAQAIEDRIIEIEAGKKTLEELNETLEQKVIMRTQELNDRNQELDKTLNHLQSTQDSLIQSEKLAGLGAMVAGVAHELNTPIGNALTVASSLNNRTKLFIQETEQGLKKSTLIAYKDYMFNAADLIERNLERASDLIVSFKHVAVDQTSSQWRQFELSQTLNEVLATLMPSFKHTRHEIIFDGTSLIQMGSYPGPLGQIITNLVNNAMIHAFDEHMLGKVTITTKLVRNSVIIECKDNGKGIASENIGRIFDPFFTTRLGQGGSGLGLNIVHSMVTGLLQGKIDVKSKVNQGTTFTLTLPQQIQPTEGS